MTATAAAILAIAAALLSTTLAHVYQEVRDRRRFKERRIEWAAEVQERRAQRLAEQRLEVYVLLLAWVEPLVKDLDRPEKSDADIDPSFELYASIDVLASTAVRQRVEALRLSLGAIRELRRQIEQYQDRPQDVVDERRLLREQQAVARQALEALRADCRSDLQHIARAGL